MIDEVKDIKLKLFFESIAACFGIDPAGRVELSL